MNRTAVFIYTREIPEKYRDVFNYLNNLRYFSIQRLKEDERILGDTDFVQAVLSEDKNHFERYYELKRLGHDLNSVAAKVAAIYNIDPYEVMRKGRQKPRVDAKGLFCYWAARELKIPLTDLARQLDMTVSGVAYPCMSPYFQHNLILNLSSLVICYQYLPALEDKYPGFRGAFHLL